MNTEELIVDMLKTGCLKYRGNHSMSVSEISVEPVKKTGCVHPVKQVLRHMKANEILQTRQTTGGTEYQLFRTQYFNFLNDPATPKWPFEIDIIAKVKGDEPMVFESIFLCEGKYSIFSFDKGLATSDEGAELLQWLKAQKFTHETLCDMVWEKVKDTEDEFLYEEAIIHYMKNEDDQWTTVSGELLEIIIDTRR